MSEFTEAIAWDGVHVTLTVFVVHDSGRRVALSVPVGLTQPGRVSYYPLEEDDEDRVLGALSCSEHALVYDEVPSDISEIVTGVLRGVIEHGLSQPGAPSRARSRSTTCCRQM